MKVGRKWWWLDLLQTSYAQAAQSLMVGRETNIQTKRRNKFYKIDSWSFNKIIKNKNFTYTT